MNIQKMMQQAQQMQEQLQKQMAEMRIEATAGGGMVTVTVNGHKQVLAVKLDPEVVSKDDVEMLQDLIVAAVNDAHRKVDEALASSDAGHDGRPAHSRAVLMARQDPLADLVAALQRLPGIGARSAQRLAYHLLKTPREEIDALVRRDALRQGPRHLLLDLQQHHRRRSVHVLHGRRSRRAASSASSSSRRTSAAVEKTRGFRGRYHVLMGAIAPLQGIGPDDLKIKGLLARVGDGGVEEVILATNPTVEGEATALYLARLLKPLGAARHPHRHGRARRQRPRLHGRVHDVEGDGGATRDVGRYAVALSSLASP